MTGRRSGWCPSPRRRLVGLSRRLACERAWPLPTPFRHRPSASPVSPLPIRRPRESASPFPIRHPPESAPGSPLPIRRPPASAPGSPLPTHRPRCASPASPLLIRRLPASAPGSPLPTRRLPGYGRAWPRPGRPPGQVGRTRPYRERPRRALPGALAGPRPAERTRRCSSRWYWTCFSLQTAARPYRRVFRAVADIRRSGAFCSRLAIARKDSVMHQAPGPATTQFKSGAASEYAASQLVSVPRLGKIDAPLESEYGRPD
jgi:hypothetical protein